MERWIFKLVLLVRSDSSCGWDESTVGEVGGYFNGIILARHRRKLKVQAAD